MTMEERAFRLWHLLDDIDTLDDACRSNDAQFRNATRTLQRKRFEILSGEEFEALWKRFGPKEPT